MYLCTCALTHLMYIGHVNRHVSVKEFVWMSKNISYSSQRQNDFYNASPLLYMEINQNMLPKENFKVKCVCVCVCVWVGGCLHVQVHMCMSAGTMCMSESMSAHVHIWKWVWWPMYSSVYTWSVLMGVNEHDSMDFWLNFNHQNWWKHFKSLLWISKQSKR